MRAVGIVLAAALLAAPARAEPLNGAYDFAANERRGGVSVCTERWEFGGDGTLTVHSGQEIATDRYRTAHDSRGDFLYTTGVSTNGLPDCIGATNTPHTQENVIYWFATNDGTISLCPPPASDPVYVSGCFATLRRAPTAN
jgi:hypothetical protein